MASDSPFSFFAPTFYTPYYFAEFVPFGSDTGDSQDAWGTTYRDRDAFKAIRTALSATREFAEVLLGIAPERQGAGADRSPLVVISPDGWTELDDVDPVVIVRQVFYSIVIIVRDKDPFLRYEMLDRLSCLTQNVLDGTDLGGVCLPALTKIRRGQFEKSSNSPEQFVNLYGEFSYIIPAFNGHNIDP